MALLLQELFLVAADLIFASALSCLLYVIGSLVVTGLVGYVVVLSCAAGAMKKVKRNICKTKDAVQSCAGQTLGKILGLVGLRGTKQGPLWQEEGAPTLLRVNQLPAGQKRGQEASKNPTSGQLPQTGMSPGGTEMQPGKIWAEEGETSQADEPKAPAKQMKVSMIPDFLLSLLFAPSWGDCCLKKRHVQWLVTLLTTLKKPRD